MTNGGVLFALEDGDTSDPRVTRPKLLWKTTIAPDSNDYGSSPTISPLGIIYVGHSSGFLGINATDGSIVARWATSDAVYSSLAVDPIRNFVYGATDGGQFFAMNYDLAVQWKFYSYSRIRTSPVIF